METEIVIKSQPRNTRTTRRQARLVGQSHRVGRLFPYPHSQQAENMNTDQMRRCGHYLNHFSHRSRISRLQFSMSPQHFQQLPCFPKGGPSLTNERE